MSKAKPAATVDEKQGEINALRQLLSNSDYMAIKYSEGLISDDDYAATRAERQGYRDRINALQEDIAKVEQKE